MNSFHNLYVSLMLNLLLKLDAYSLLLKINFKWTIIFIILQNTKLPQLIKQPNQLGMCHIECPSLKISINLKISTSYLLLKFE